MAQLFLVFLKLGLVSFGGPVAHLGYFRTEFVEKRRWLDDSTYGELVALAQVLPGPGSSQVNLAVGLLRGGWAGAAVAWLGFTLPSALLMLALGLGIAAADAVPGGVLAGLKAVAAAVVLNALIGMARQLAPDWPRRGLAVFTAAALILLPAPGIIGLAVAMPLAIAAGAAVGAVAFAGSAPATQGAAFDLRVSRRTGALLLLSVPTAVAALFLIDVAAGGPLADLAARFFRTGALVFGGGHVVLPLLQGEVVAPGFVPEEVFLAGYGAAQALPGPLFAFAAFLGAAMGTGEGGTVAGAVAGAVALLAIFLPGALLMIGAMPFQRDIARWRRGRGALAGVNAVVVGLLAAAFVDPVLTAGVTDWRQGLVAVAAFALLWTGRVPVAAIVAAGAAVGLLWPAL